MATVSVTNTDASLSGRTLALTEANQTITGLKTFDRGTSTPFAVVAGAGVVDNLVVDPAILSTAVPVAKGGTGLTALGAALQVIRVNAGATALEFADPSAGGSDPTDQTATETGAQDNYNLTQAFTVLHCTGAAPVFSGFRVAAASPITEARVLIICEGTTAKVLNQDALSDAANRIVTPSAAGQIVGLNGMMLLTYDTVASRWRCALLDPGVPIAWTPNDASGAALTFTGVSGVYQQCGRGVHIRFDLRYPSTANGSSSAIGGLPFAIVGSACLAIGFTVCSIPMYIFGFAGSTISPIKQAGGANLTNAELTLAFVGAAGTYFIA